MDCKERMGENEKKKEQSIKIIIFYSEDLFMQEKPDYPYIGFPALQPTSILLYVPYGTNGSWVDEV